MENTIMKARLEDGGSVIPTRDSPKTKTVTKVKRNNGFTNLVVNTWEPTLKKERDLPLNR